MKRLFLRRDFLLGLIVGAICLLACGLLLNYGVAQQMHRDRFESQTPNWIKGHADVAFVEKVHIRTNQGARDGQRCEYLQLDAKQGHHIYYQYPTGHAPITEELSISVYIKSNRRGMQLLARVVLPHERNPKSPDDLLTTFIHGDTYRQVGRWEKLEIGQPVLLTQRQQQLMQKQAGRALNFKDAYVDTILLNVYDGPGHYDIWIDDLQIGPIQDDVPAAAANPIQPGKTPATNTGDRRAATVEFSGTQLLVGGKRFFPRGIRHTNTPLQVLRNAGFNTVWFPASANPRLYRQASELGFWLVPSLPLTQKNSHLVSRNILTREVSHFPENDSVIFWNVGGSLAYEQATLVDRTARVIRSVDSGRPLGGDVWDGFRPYSRSLDLVGAHRWPLSTALELTGYREWLNERRLLANPGTFMWTWVQNHTPENFAQMLYNQSAKKKFNVPVGPQPAQVRLLTYTALGAGCRGLAFWSDRFLADSHQGRDRLLECALLNKELEMLEPLLLTTEGPPAWIETSESDVQAAVFRTAKGILVLPMWLGKGAQFVPGQSAINKLKIVVPQVPQGTQVWEVTPGEVRGLRARRVLGGTRVTLPEFGLTTAIVFTSDTNLIVRFQEYCRHVRQLAAQWTFQQVEQEIQKVVVVQKQLHEQGQAIPDTQALLDQAQARLQAAKEHWDHHLFGDAYRESQRALRPLRILMRTQWEKATEFLDSPVALPYAVSYYTLPKHWEMVREIRATTPGNNLLAGGDFEVQPNRSQSGWRPEYVKLDDVQMIVERVGKDSPGSNKETVTAKNGKLCAMLHIQPRSKETHIDALERTYLALGSPTVHLQPGTLVRISAWIYIPQPITASADGVLFYDSIGGEPLAVRMTGRPPRQKKQPAAKKGSATRRPPASSPTPTPTPTPLAARTGWTKISLYRRIPASGSISVTLALSGLGTVYFDDIRIEPLQPGSR